MKALYEFVFVLLIIVTCAEEQQFNFCQDEQDFVTDFDLNKFLGIWYQVQIQRKDQNVTERDNCVTSHFSLNGDNLVNFGISYLDVSKSHEFANYFINLSYPDKSPLPGKFNFTEEFVVPGVNYKILSTDYINYAVIAICYVDLDYEEEYQISHIISRTPKLNQEILSKVEDFIEQFLVKEKLITINQDIDICNDHNYVITDFDLEKFLGKWYVIKLINEETNITNCITSEFNLDHTNGLINFKMSFLKLPNNYEEIDSSVVLSNPDVLPLSGKLNFTEFPGNFFKILVTDYINIAVVSIFIDADEPFYKVHILSRTSQLSEEVLPIVDHVIDKFLHEKKMTNVNHDNKLCNYGDRDIIHNFEMEKFLGKWYHIKVNNENSTNTINCVTLNYSLNNDGTVNMNMSVQILSDRYEFQNFIIFLSYPNEMPLLAKFNFSDHSKLFYQIRETDYINFAVISITAVADGDIIETDLLWVLSRTLELREEDLHIINKFIQKYDLFDKLYSVIHNSELCKYDEWN